jgi:ABC-type nitrate/sulfonate/bicarbonate transport system permease component
MTTAVPPTPPDTLVAQSDALGLEVQRRAALWRVRSLGSVAGRSLWGLFGLVLFVGVWQWLSLRLPLSQLASPQQVLDDLRSHFWLDPPMEVYGFGPVGYWDMLRYSIENVLLGTAIGGAIGVIGGLALARTRLIQATLEPILLTLGTLPILAAAPLLVLWFGIVSYTQVMLVAAYTAILLTQFAQRAADNLHPVYEERARTCGASRLAQLRIILLPAVVPEILGGLRISLAFAWGLEVFAETLGSPSGLGQTILTLANVDDVAGLLACVLLLGITALLFDFLLVGCVKTVTVWQ